MLNADGLHVAGTLIHIEISIVETGGATQMRGSEGCDPIEMPIRICTLESTTTNLIEMPIKILNCTPVRTMYSCEYFKPLSISQ